MSRKDKSEVLEVSRSFGKCDIRPGGVALQRLKYLEYGFARRDRTGWTKRRSSSEICPRTFLYPLRS